MKQNLLVRDRGRRGFFHAISQTLFRCGLGYNTVNTARFALSSIVTLNDDSKYGEHPLVCRTQICDVNIVLHFLKTVDFACKLSLKDLSLKVTMLLCLTTAQRGQTVHSLDVNYIQAFEDKYRITVMQKLKSSKPETHLEPIVLHACVFEHLKEYLSRTSDLRNGQLQFLLSYTKPHKAVSARSTISRWTKRVMKSAGMYRCTLVIAPDLHRLLHVK